MNLSHLTDSVLLIDTKVLVKKERETTSKILHHLREIERRRLFSDLGYSSLFAYTTQELGYSDSGAYRRIQAARLLKDLPKLEEKIENGSLSLTNIGQASQFFKNNNIQDEKEKEEIFDKIGNTTKKECEKILFDLQGDSETPQPAKKEKVRRNSKTTQELKFTVNDKTLEKLQELKNLLAHEGEKSMDELLNLMLDTTIATIKKKKHKTETTAKAKSLPPANVDKRYISAAAKRAVYERDKGKCVKCKSTYKLQYDHQNPYSLGGKTQTNNLRLLCFSCNQRQRIRARL